MSKNLAYKGTTILGFAAAQPPRPSCCSDPRYLCRRCAALALEDGDLTANCGRHQPGFVLNGLPFDPESDFLEPPTVLNQLNPHDDAADDDLLTNQDDEEPSWDGAPPILE